MKTFTVIIPDKPSPDKDYIKITILERDGSVASGTVIFETTEPTLFHKLKAECHNIDSHRFPIRSSHSVTGRIYERQMPTLKPLKTILDK